MIVIVIVFENINQFFRSLTLIDTKLNVLLIYADEKKSYLLINVSFFSMLYLYLVQLDVLVYEGYFGTGKSANWIIWVDFSTDWHMRKNLATDSS